LHIKCFGLLWNPPIHMIRALCLRCLRPFDHQKYTVVLRPFSVTSGYPWPSATGKSPDFFKPKRFMD
jgi:hypothetical protein